MSATSGNINPIFEKAPAAAGLQFAAADTTTKKTLVTGGTDGTRVDAMNVSSTDTAAVVLNVYVTVSGTDYFRGSVSIAAATGTAGAATIDLIPTLAATLGYIGLGNGHVLKIACNATMTAAKVLDIVAQYGDY